VDCNLIQSHLVAYDFGTLADADRDAVESHLLACPRCLQTYLQLKRHLARGPGAERPGEEMRRRLRAEVAATFGADTRPSFVRWLWRPIPLYQGLVAAVMLAAFAGLSTPRPAAPGQTTAPSPPPAAQQQHIDASRSTPDTQTIF
jgi:anti-sigma factor RsiW